MQSAPELSRLQRLNDRLKRRKEIANQCHQIFAAMPEVTVAPTRSGKRQVSPMRQFLGHPDKPGAG